MAKKKKIVRPTYVPKEQRREKKPLDKKTRNLIIGICAAVVVAIALFAIFYDDGSLPVRGGVVVTEGDNWLVGNLGTTSKPKYYKFGEMTPLEGFTHDPEQSVRTDTNIQDYGFKADDANSPIASYYVSAVAQQPASMIENVRTQYLSFYGETGSVGEVKTITLQGREAVYFDTVYSQPVEQTENVESAEGETEPAMEQKQSVTCYLTALRGNSVLISLQTDVTETHPALTDEEIVSWLKTIAGTLTLVEEE